MTIALQKSPFIGTTSSSFVSLYLRCGRMDLARKVFNEIPERDVVAWTALIIEHVHNGEPQKGLRCLRHMHCEDAPMPNARTWEGGFLACGSLGAVKRGCFSHTVFGFGCVFQMWGSLRSVSILL
ncbi:Pentatricopeptide repeat-containing protein, mitochondrial [Glycine soja]|uniref:Pentatricopeptide repeat-containing protein n=2 Tax=Glycine subgen. Soja TaxID=1462606 RepID=A0A0R0JGJ7_SOYBN|nr:Pentatricopeptide repeat-containing protein, mitochondrial [Glycine soja]